MNARLFLYRAIDLIHRLGVYEGSKMVVLFSTGLLLNTSTIPELTGLLNQLNAEASRARVRFYVIDARRLEALAPLMRVEAEPTVGDPRQVMTASVTAGLNDTYRAMQNGLRTVAELTAGKALLNTNDLGDIFDKVVEDLEGYYVLGYYPKRAGQQGRRRKIRIEVNRKGLRLDYRKSYHERKQFTELSKAGRRRHLEQSILATLPRNEVPLRVNYRFFRGPDSRPLVAYCVGLDPPLGGLSTQLRYTLVVTVRGGQEGKLLGLEGRRIQIDLPADAHPSSERLRKKLQFRARLLLPAGRYEFKTVVRDEASGLVGTQQDSIEVPDFSGAANPSSLLLTNTARKISPDPKRRKGPRKAAVAEAGLGIDIGDTTFLPEAADVFARGKPIYVLYDLYNVPEVLLTSPRGPGVFLLRDGRPLERPPFATYEVFPSQERQELRYLTTLTTETLEPGEYNLVVVLPTGETGLAQRFTLVEP